MKSDVSDLLDSAGWPAFVVEAAGTIRRANQAAINFFGPKLEGETTSLTALWPEGHEVAEQFLNRWERNPAAMVSLPFCGKGGTVHTFNAQISFTTREGQKRFLFQLFPVTPPDRAPDAAPGNAPATDAHQVQKQRLDCALQLTRTVALDFSKVLSSILGHSSILLAQTELSHPFRPSLLEIEKAAGKAAEIAQHLTAFSRQEKEPQQQAAGNLNSLLRRAASLFQHNAASKVAYSLILDSKLHAVRYDEAKMFQAFAKIMENAQEAVGAYGNVRVTTRSIEVTTSLQDGNVHLSAGTFVCVEISDDGPGMEPEVLARAFEPFFTTKKGHRGLGLAWVYGVVTNHGGSVGLTSAPKQGAIVRVYLPAAKTSPQEPANRAAKTESGRRQTVLVVDDEELMLTLGRAILSAAGYEIVTATSGQQALELLTTGRTQVDLLLTDLVMPQMSGRELIEQLRTVAPAIPVIRMSGYARPPGEAEEDYLHKPFTSEDLVRYVKRALDRAGGN